MKYIGINTTPQILRQHFNAHLRYHFDLSNHEINLLNSGMNHTEEIANLYYVFWNTSEIVNEYGNIFFQKLTQNRKTATKNINNKNSLNNDSFQEPPHVRIHDLSLNNDTYHKLQQLRKTIPELNQLIQYHDSSFNQMKQFQQQLSSNASSAIHNTQFHFKIENSFVESSIANQQQNIAIDDDTESES
jgi:hypothetical protein